MASQVSIILFVNQTRPCLSPPSRCTHFFITLMEIDFSFPLPYLPRGQIGDFHSLLELQLICGRIWNTILTDKQRKLTFKIFVCHEVIYFSKEVTEMENIPCNTSVSQRRENRLFPCKSFLSTIETSIKIGSYSWGHS